MVTEREAALLLVLTDGVGPARARQMLDACGSYRGAVRAALDGPPEKAGVTVRVAREIRRGASDRCWQTEFARARRVGSRFVSTESPEYPRALLEIVGPPLGLFVAGRAPSDLGPMVAIVGSRTATPRGLAVARELAGDLCNAGLTVVSGLARGIDTAAHEGAIEVGGRTVAVLGSGLGRVYPPENEGLAREVARTGALVSEFPTLMEPIPGQFPRRNRVISGMSAGVVVVEAARRSGALITAARALEQGREVFAVPGPVDEPLAGGPNGLLKAGARLVEDARDVLDELAAAWGPFRARSESAPEGDGGGAGDPGDEPGAGAEGGHDAVAERVLSHLSLTALGVDELAARAAAPIAAVLSALMILELSGAAERVAGGRYVLGARERDRSHRGG